MEHEKQILNVLQLKVYFYSKVSIFVVFEVRGMKSICQSVKRSRGGGGGYSPNFWVGVCRTVLKTLTLFQTKIYDFSYHFSDLTPKIYTPFQTFRLKNPKPYPISD